MKRFTSIIITSSLTALLIGGCYKPAPGTSPWTFQVPEETPAELEPTETARPLPVLPTPRSAGTPYFTPTPDEPRTLPTLRASEEYYTVQVGDSLGAIAQKYNLDLGLLISANSLINPDLLEIGQVITIPALIPSVPPSSFKIIPDSELVYGPVSTTFETEAFIRTHKGFLSTYIEDVEGTSLTGAQIVERICYEYSINPRLLLSLLEYRSGWVTSRNVTSSVRDYPMEVYDPYRAGLYKQLAWAANQLNRGYYLWKIDALSYISMGGGSLVMLAPDINAGTAAVQYMLGLQSQPSAWQKAVSEQGLYQVYTSFFGIPFDLTYVPLLPADIAQPKMRLPFEPGQAWSFTSGPHGGWGDGSAWAALDFAPPGDAFGCFKSDAWVTAVADGYIIRSGDGAVVQDLDKDGLEQTGWTVLYMHIESRDRIEAGTYLKAGDRIGHASCEGGFSNGTHLHLARRYNGEWIPADTGIPFLLSGWVSAGDGWEYSGTLTRGDQTVYSWDGRIEENQIQY